MNSFLMKIQLLFLNILKFFSVMTKSCFLPSLLSYKKTLFSITFLPFFEESFECGRKLMRNESLLVGGSSGTILSVALKEARKMKAGSRIAMIFPDSIRNYMTKYLSNDWMIENSFMEDPLEQVG